MSEEQDIPTDDTVAGEDTEGHKRHFRVEESGGEDTEGHKKHFRIEESGAEDTEGHRKHVRVEDAGDEDTEGHGAAHGRVEEAVTQGEDTDGHALRGRP